VQPPSRELELMVEELHRLGVCGRLSLRRRHQLLEPPHLDPEVFKTEGGRAMGPTLVGEEKRAVVRKRRGQRVETMIIEGELPTRITESPVQPDQSRGVAPIAPGELAVQELDLLKLASSEGLTKLAHEPQVQVSVIFIFSLVYKIEIP
jgi:hypothetical protein